MRRRYRAFLSYSHRDARFAQWLHRSLERWKIAPDLVGRATEAGDVPRTLRPIFRDRDDFAGGASLKSATEAALKESDFLVVICSPNAARSRYVDAEVRFFKQLGRAHRVIPVILSGEPDSDDDECFPPGIKYDLDEEGEPTGKPAEPIAPDARDEGDGRHRAAAKVVAGLLGLSFDEIAKREEKSQRLRLRMIAAVAGAMACLTVAAGYLAWLANERRIEAEANYSAAKSAASGLFESVAKDLSEAAGVPLSISRKILQRAEAIYAELETRAPDDLEVLGSNARTLSIFANSFRDRVDWETSARVADRAEKKFTRLIQSGDQSQNWIALRAAIRMTKLTALHQMGRDEAEIKALRQEARDDIERARKSDPDDMQSTAIAAAASLQDALLYADANDPGAGADRLQEGINLALSSDDLIRPDGRSTPVALFLLLGLVNQADLFEKANRLEDAIRAQTELVGVYERMLGDTPKPADMRLKMAEAFFQIERLAKLNGDIPVAQRSARFGRFASYALAPWREDAKGVLLQKAAAALNYGEQTLAADNKDIARTWFQGCAAMYERLLENDAADQSVGYQMIRCLDKIERTHAPASPERFDALKASRHETERLANRFSGLRVFVGFVDGRLGGQHESAGEFAAAAKAYESAGDIIVRELSRRRDAFVVNSAGQSYVSMGHNLLRSGDRPGARGAYERALEIYEDAGSDTDAYLPETTDILERLGEVAPEGTPYYRRIEDLLQSSADLSEDLRDRLKRAREAIGSGDAR